MEVFYHGTCRLFDTFDPNRLGSGEGKSKFGHGIYITSSYTTAVPYMPRRLPRKMEWIQFMYIQ